jgi:hypothetical protein
MTMFKLFGRNTGEITELELFLRNLPTSSSVYIPIDSLLRSTIKKQSSNLPIFGPLTDNSVVSAAALPLLVRETALNGARAVRSKIDGYRHFFEERDTYLLDTIRKLKYQNNSFEKYCTEIFQPSCNAEPILTPELQKRALSDTHSDTGSIANSIQSSSYSSSFQHIKEIRTRTESHVSTNADLTPKIGISSRNLMSGLPSTPNFDPGSS